MSRIGKAPIEIPAGVTVTVNGDLVTVKGPKGELSQKVNSDLTVKVEDGHVVVTRPSDDREHRAQHGLYRALIIKNKRKFKIHKKKRKRKKK